MSPNGYPFRSRAQILARIATEPAFAAECVTILQYRYEHRAEGGPGMGWMGSHASKASALAAKVASGDAGDKELAEAAKLVGRYSKQLARVFRERELVSRPELGAQAVVFGVGGGVREAEPVPSSPPPGKNPEPPPAPKKRGRPKGSKNKPRQEPARRRRARG